jgi:hypothetical protein
MDINDDQKHTIIDSLQILEKLTDETTEIRLEDIFHILSKKGSATLLVLFSFPFCFPIQIPGFSTPFGLMLCFLGLRIGFAKKPWWPKWVLEKKIKSSQLKALLKHITKGFLFFKRIIHPRMFFLTQNPVLLHLHGLLVFILSLLLSLPLPIPFSNMLAAIPIFFIGLGLLEDDGLMIIIGYLFALACFLAFFGLFWFGKSQLENIFH